MSTLRLTGSTSGYTEVTAPAVAGSNTLVLPGGNGTADQALVTDGSGTLSFTDRSRMVLETAKASTSGTEVDFTDIPSWVKKITVMFQGVSTNGTSVILVQVGDGSIVTSGYLGGSASLADPNAVSVTLRTAGFGIDLAANAAAVRHGAMTITNITGNTWVNNAVIARSDIAIMGIGSGSVALSGALDRIRITTVNGTDTFDAGSINLLLEG